MPAADTHCALRALARLTLCPEVASTRPVVATSSSITDWWIASPYWRLHSVIQDRISSLIGHTGCRETQKIDRLVFTRFDVLQENKSSYQAAVQWAVQSVHQSDDWCKYLWKDISRGHPAPGAGCAFFFFHAFQQLFKCMHTFFLLQHSPAPACLKTSHCFLTSKHKFATCISGWMEFRVKHCYCPVNWPSETRAQCLCPSGL